MGGTRFQPATVDPESFHRLFREPANRKGASRTFLPNCVGTIEIEQRAPSRGRPHACLGCSATSQSPSSTRVIKDECRPSQRERSRRCLLSFTQVPAPWFGSVPAETSPPISSRTAGADWSGRPRLCAARRRPKAAEREVVRSRRGTSVFARVSKEPGSPGRSTRCTTIRRHVGPRPNATAWKCLTRRFARRRCSPPNNCSASSRDRWRACSLGAWPRGARRSLPVRPVSSSVLPARFMQVRFTTRPSPAAQFVPTRRGVSPHSPKPAARRFARGCHQSVSA